jgi:hypothetical protein
MRKLMYNGSVKKLMICILLIFSVLPFSGFSYNVSAATGKNIAGDDAFVTEIQQINTDFTERLKEAEASDSEFGLRTLIVTSSAKLPNTFGAIEETAFFNGITILKYASEEEAKSANDSLNQIEGVTSQPDRIVTASTVTPAAAADNYEYKTNGANIIGAPQFNEYYNQLPNESKKEVIVAVFDSGINENHQMFTDRLVEGKSFVGGGIDDVLGHGTHVAGTVADLTLSNVKIMPIKIIDENGKGSDTIILSGIQYLLSQKTSGKNIVAANFSLGSSPLPITGSQYKNSKMLWDNMMNSLYNANILPVVASGNESNRLVNATTGRPYGQPNDNYRSLPAGCDNVLVVSAYSSMEGENLTTKKPLIASFSNWGTHIDVSAPGVYIASASNTSNTELKYFNGTSMAAPHAAAAVAMIASDGSVARTLSQIESLIQQSALANADFGDQGKDKYFGYGGLSLLGAIDNNFTPTAPNEETSTDTEPTKPIDDETPDTVYYMMWNYATVVVPARSNATIKVNSDDKQGKNSYFIFRNTDAEIQITANSGYEIVNVTVNGQEISLADSDRQDMQLVIPNVQNLGRYIVLASFAAADTETTPVTDVPLQNDNNDNKQTDVPLQNDNNDNKQTDVPLQTEFPNEDNTSEDGSDNLSLDNGSNEKNSGAVWVVEGIVFSIFIILLLSSFRKRHDPVVK